jgi:hypothetical protein
MCPSAMKTENCVVAFPVERSGDRVAPKKDLAEEKDRNYRYVKRPGCERFGAISLETT